ncbi:hypothetical protein J4G07_05535 [Candidatus Poribacteria bacterium]|nr:hypothetical protein [Candidatus Poribacteria bacterium]
MLKKFLNNPNALWQVLIVLLLAGGLAFAGMYDGFVVETEAQKSCCGGNTDAIRSDGTIAQLKTGSCCGSEVPEVPSSGTGDLNNVNIYTGSACNCLGRGCDDEDCSGCSKIDSCDGGCDCSTCNAHCSNKDSDSTMCGDGSGCTDGDRSGGAEG